MRTRGLHIAAALLAGRDFVTPDDVKRMALPALRHRIAPSPELELEGRAYDLIHELNTLRRDRGFELTDRVKVVVPERWRDVVERHGEWVAGEVEPARYEFRWVAPQKFARFPLSVTGRKLARFAKWSTKWLRNTHAN